MDFTQEQKDRIQLIINKELSYLYDQRHRNSLIIKINSKPIGDIDNEKLQEKRQNTLEMYQRLVEMYQKDIELLESIETALTS